MIRAFLILTGLAWIHARAPWATLAAVTLLVGLCVGVRVGRETQAFMGGRNFVRGQRKLIREGLPR